MRIVFASDNNSGLKSVVSHHFGKCPYYIIVDIDEDNNIKDVFSIENPYASSHSPGMVPQFINSKNANVMISGGMGQRALEFFNQYGIEVVTGVEGIVENILESYLKGKVKGYKPCKDDSC